MAPLFYSYINLQNMYHNITKFYMAIKFYLIYAVTLKVYKEKEKMTHGHGSRTGEIVIDNSANKPQRVTSAADN